MSECKKCGFVGCICRRGERDEQCSARESGGVRCEKREGHDGDHECPNALDRFLSSKSTAGYTVIDEQGKKNFPPGSTYNGYRVREGGIMSKYPESVLRDADKTTKHLNDVHSAYPESMRRDVPLMHESPPCVPHASAKKTGPGSRYVEVPAAKIAEKLMSMGFEQTRIGNEIAFERVHKMCKHTRIVVNTSIPVNGTVVRDCGEDAIHVLAIFEKPWKGRQFKKIVARGKRIHRSGSIEAVLERIYERAREVYQAATDSLKNEKTTCFECCKPRRGDER